ncbi:MAG TPA: hypothetical protein VIF62_21980 [Labilithrix sp.]
MRRSFFLALFALPLVAALSASACSDDTSLSPANADGGDARVPPGTPPPATIDAPDDSPPPPTCHATDLTNGTGAKWCDLPGATSDLTVPPDFCVHEFTTQPILEARTIRFAPNGDLFVGVPSKATVGGAFGGRGSILVLSDDNHDGLMDALTDFLGGPYPTGASDTCAGVEAADPLNVACVHGVAIVGNYLYFTRSDELRRVSYTDGQRAVSGTSELVAQLGGTPIPDVRWTHTIDVRKDGSLLVTRGRFDSDSCSDEQMTRGAVMAIHVEQAGATLPLTPETVATGFRNPMYVRCAPTDCRECFVDELSGDNWDGVGGREKVALISGNGENYGYPCCVGRNATGPNGGGTDCSGVGHELVSIQLHDTPFGLDFERGLFPAPYTHGMFVALHGVVSSYTGTGVVWIATDPQSLRPTAAPAAFADGFGKPSNRRATDVAFAPDGRLFVVDDNTGKIYWIAPKTLQMKP